MTSIYLTVSQLNRQIRLLLENDVGKVSVEGEISNLSKPASGHFYFTLKDESAQIRCVFFKNRNFKATTEIKNGGLIVACGTLSLYEARGDYQLIVETIKDTGLGDLFKKFEALKIKLQALGLFDANNKKPIPKFPQTIGIITSSNAAALHDILTTLKRRYPIAKIMVYASEVQGTRASNQLINSIERANLEKKVDIIILARGGGSIEDLWSFNEEALAFAIAKSTIPIVSGVGHETDFTIADFVADLRAPTPTAAAQAISPNMLDIIDYLRTFELNLLNIIRRILEHKRLLLKHELQKLSSPKHLILRHWQSLDYSASKLQKYIRHDIALKRHKLDLIYNSLSANNPESVLEKNKIRLQNLTNKLRQLMDDKIKYLQHTLQKNLATLNVMNPYATLERGYAIVTHKNHVLFNVDAVNINDEIHVQLATGNLKSKVIKKENPQDKI